VGRRFFAPAARASRAPRAHHGCLHEIFSGLIYHKFTAQSQSLRRSPTFDAPIRQSMRALPTENLC
jgi:hypothetical protein